MPSQDDDSPQRFALGLIFMLVALVVVMVLGIGINHRAPQSKPAGEMAGGGGVPPGRLTALSPPSLVSVNAADSNSAADAASIRVEQGIVKFYFASGKADLAPGAAMALADMVAAASAGRRLVVSGFHDASGNVEKNAELAKQRALALLAVLKTAGVPENRIVLKKPEKMTGSGSDAEARRVEISVQ